jgi:predicted GIY-YIG superfamily endonuclease
MFFDLSFPRVPAIYCIINRVNGKFYIGSTVDFRERIREHRNCLRRKKHHSLTFQRSYNKYGEESFDSYLLEDLSGVDKKELRKREQKYLDVLQPYLPLIGFNRGKEVNRLRVGIKHTLESKNKIRQKALERVWTEQHRLNNDLSRQKPIISFDWQGYPVNKFDSLKSCSKYYGVTSSTICPTVGSEKEYKSVFLHYLQKI